MKLMPTIIVVVTLLGIIIAAFVALKSMATVTVPNLLSPGQNLTADIFSWAEERIGLKE